MKKERHNTRTQPGRRGFSLVEALISLVVCGIIMAGAALFFVQNQRVGSAQIALSVLHANLRFATDTIETQLQSVGAMVGHPWIVKQTLSADVPLVRGNNTGSQTAYAAGVNAFAYYPTYTADSADILQFPEAEILSNVCVLSVPSDADLVVSKTTLIDVNDVLMVTDANLDPAGGVYEVFQVTAVDNSVAGSTRLTHSTSSTLNGAKLSKIYLAGSMVMRMHFWTYAVKPPDASFAYPRLVRKDRDGPWETMAEYVEDLQVAVGLYNSGTKAIDWYNDFTALICNPSNLANLRAVRVSLTGRTPMMQESMVGKQTGSTDINYNRPQVEDRAAETGGLTPYYREVYTKVIMIRNLRPTTGS